MNEEYIEIDLMELARAVLRRWWLVLLLMLISAGMAYTVTDRYVIPVYQARATLFIGKETNSIASLNLSDLAVGDQLVSDYRELIKTRLVTEQVIEDLSLLATRESLVSNLGISIIEDSRFMYVTYKDPVPERAQIIVNKLADVLTDKAETIVGVKNIQIVDEAIAPKHPISPNKRKNTAMAGMAGAAIAAGLIFLEMMMQNTVKNEEEIERLIGKPVLGMIPKFKGEARRR